MIIKERMNSKHLVCSMALQLCEIVSWMNKYILEHPDKDKNLRKCKPIKNFIGGKTNKGGSISGKY